MTDDESRVKSHKTPPTLGPTDPLWIVFGDKEETNQRWWKITKKCLNFHAQNNISSNI